MSRTSILLVMLWCSSGQAEVRRFAVVVGSNAGEGIRAAPLRYADDDAVAMHELLLEAGVESALLVSQDDDTARLHPLTAITGEPTLARLLQVFAAQSGRMREAQARGEEVEWTFFFSGHGDVKNGEGILGLSKGSLTRTQLHHKLLDHLPANRAHVIIDACKSSSLVAGKGPGGKRVPFPYAFAGEVERPGNIGFLLSASSAGDSHEWDRFQAGVFSYELRSALRGAADANLDGRVSYAEIGAFLQTANQGIANPMYRPDFTILPPQGAAGFDQPVMTWSSAEVVVAEAALGQHYLERTNGERLLDLYPEAGFFPNLHLPSDRPLFIRSADRATELRVDEEVVSSLRTSTLQPSMPATRPKGSLNLAFGQLFALPFGASAVERWEKTWRPPDFASLAEAAEPPLTDRVRPVVGWIALGGAGMAVIGFSVAWQRSETGLALSQVERMQRNKEVVAFNVVGVTSLAIAASAASTWLALTFFKAGGASISLTTTGAESALIFHGTWP